MTINFLDKGGTGFGRGTKDPRALPFSIAYGNHTYIKRGNSTAYYDSHSLFWGYLQDIGTAIVYEVADADTYKTVADITNKSGKVFNIITPTHYSYGGSYIRIKLTIDGIEYILGRSSLQVRYARLMIGGSYPFTPVTTDTIEYPGQMGSYRDTGLYRFYTNYYPYRPSFHYIVAPLIHEMGGAPFLYFEDSFKYEVLVASVNTNSYYNFAGVTYNLLG